MPPNARQVLAEGGIQAQVLAMEAGITSRRKVVEATGYDIEEVDRENAADAADATPGIMLPADVADASPHLPPRNT